MKIVLWCNILIALTCSHIAFSQEDKRGSFEEKREYIKEYKNKINVGWAYYGRGNGLSLSYDREISEFISAGIGLEEYVIEEDVETSVFLLMDFHLEKLFNFDKLEIYPGIEWGFFENKLDYHVYLGMATDITEKIGVYTEVGTRGVLGLYLKL